MQSELADRRRELAVGALDLVEAIFEANGRAMRRANLEAAANVATKA